MPQQPRSHSSGAHPHGPHGAAGLPSAGLAPAGAAGAAALIQKRGSAPGHPAHHAHALVPVVAPPWATMEGTSAGRGSPARQAPAGTASRGCLRHANGPGDWQQHRGPWPAPAGALGGAAHGHRHAHAVQFRGTESLASMHFIDQDMPPDARLSQMMGTASGMDKTIHPRMMGKLPHLDDEASSTHATWGSITRDTLASTKPRMSASATSGHSPGARRNVESRPNSRGTGPLGSHGATATARIRHASR